jgi:hypothetical protein
VVAALVGLCALAGCSNSPGAAEGGTNNTSSTSVSPATSTSPQSTNASSTTTPSVAPAVLDAYRAGWAAVEDATAAANPADPELQATMVNPVLHQVIGNLVTDNAEGIVGTGSIQLNPHVVSINGTTAIVLDCAYSSSFLIYKKTGKQVPPITKPEHDADKATLVLVGSTWKTKSRQITEGSCPAGY